MGNLDRTAPWNSIPRFFHCIARMDEDARFSSRRSLGSVKMQRAIRANLELQSHFGWVDQTAERTS